MPKTFYITTEWRHSGIDITWTKSTRRLRIGGWYDSFVGIQSRELSLADLCRELGITAKDLKATVKELETLEGRG